MQFSAPIYILKRKARLLARETDAPLHQALDKVAAREGYRSWSHLASSKDNEHLAQDVLLQLNSGDLCLVGARPGQGKTRVGLTLAAQASCLERKGYFFTLEYHAGDVVDLLTDVGVDPRSAKSAVVVDTSDDISADYIIRRLSAETAPALIVVDYLQLLDQKRSHPSLDDQMRSLRHYVDETGAICALISQIDRAFDLGGKPMPGVSDIRLPNPLDLSVFKKFFFLHNGKIRLHKDA